MYTQKLLKQCGRKKVDQRKLDKGMKKNKMTRNDYIIRLEEKKDYREVENLTRESFWNVYRPGCMEHYVLHCYREDKAFVPELDYVMVLDGKIIGQIMYVRSEIKTDDGSKIPIMTFGPISIAPMYKRQGYGKILLDYSMEKAKEMGIGALAITGNIQFYGKSGFVLGKAKGILYEDDPEAAYFLIKELEEGFLDGITGRYKDPEGYFVCEKNPTAFEAYEATFPRKDKMIQTQRMVLKMLTDEEMKQLIEAEEDPEMVKAYTQMYRGAIQHPAQRQWHGVWVMELADHTRIGDFCFKGFNEDGSVEIGYGVQPQYEGQGYTTEMVIAMTKWALSQPGVKRVEAETEPSNKASQRVLEKAGFKPSGVIGEEGPRFYREH